MMFPHALASLAFLSGSAFAQLGPAPSATLDLGNEAAATSPIAASGATLVAGKAPLTGGKGQMRSWTRGAAPGGWTALSNKIGPGLGLDFARSVDIDGDRAIVGAPNGLIYSSSRVYIFERQGNGWIEVAELAPPGFGYGAFGESVAIEGDVAVVGAPWIAVNNVGVGFIYTEDTPGTWSLAATRSTTAAQGFSGHQGRAVAVSGDRVVIGGVNVDVFERNLGGPNQWGLEAEVDPGPLAPIGWGNRLALEGDRLVVGSPDLGSVGTVQVFKRNQAGASLWEEQASFTGAPGDGLGDTVAIAGNRVAAGAHLADVGHATHTGAVRLYEQVAGDWVLAQSLFSPDSSNAQSYGQRIAGDGPVLFVREDGTGSGATLGSLIHVYEDCGGSVSYCTAGISASGCQASVSALGTASASAASGFTLSVSGLEGAKDGQFFWGTSGRQANPWGNGTSFQCVTPPTTRGGLLPGTGTSGSCDGSATQDLAALWTSNPAKHPGSGSTVQAQYWYRDPLNTSNQTTSLSQAIEFTVCP